MAPEGSLAGWHTLSCALSHMAETFRQLLGVTDICCDFQPVPSQSPSSEPQFLICETEVGTAPTSWGPCGMQRPPGPALTGSRTLAATVTGAPCC